MPKHIHEVTLAETLQFALNVSFVTRMPVEISFKWLKTPDGEALKDGDYARGMPLRPAKPSDLSQIVVLERSPPSSSLCGAME